MKYFRKYLKSNILNFIHSLQVITVTKVSHTVMYAEEFVWTSSGLNVDRLL